MMTSSWLLAASTTLVQAALILLAAGSAAGLLIGLGLLFMPERAAAMLVRGYVLPPVFDRGVFWERFFYRHHWSLGGLIVVGAAYVLIMLLSIDNPGRVAMALGMHIGGGVDIIVINSLRALLLLGTLLALPFGAIIFARPSLLKGLEQTANRWIDTPAPRLAAGAPLSHPRWWGLFFVAGALYTLSALGLAFIAH